MSFLKDKFEEANYFLSKMDEAQNDMVVFGHNLSAFLSAFWSIRHKLPEVNKKMIPEEGKEIFFLAEVRNVNVHESIVLRRQAVQINIEEPLALKVSVHDIVVRAEGTEELTTSESEEKKSEEENNVKLNAKRNSMDTWYYFNLSGPFGDKVRGNLKDTNISDEDLERIMNKDIVTLCQENIHKLGELIPNSEK